MTEPKPKPKAKAKRASRATEYDKRKAKRLAENSEAFPQNEVDAEALLVKAELAILEKNTKHLATDADRDIDFAYRNMASVSITPLMAPSLGAWSWYVYSRTWPEKFLEITQKREDAKSKAAGTITSQRMEDDKRHQFGIIDRIEKQLTLDIKGVIADLMGKFPEDTLLECRKYKPAWDAFHEKYPQ